MLRLKNVLILFLFVILFQNLFGQKISNIDFDEIKLAIQDTSSNYYYPLLIARFQEVDTTLSLKEYRYIYYGSVYNENYNPYGTSHNEKKFNELFKQGKFDEAVVLGHEIIEGEPVNLGVLYRMLLCHHRLGKKAEAQAFANMYFSLISAIYGSGDGKSMETAYVVIKIFDEYMILNDLNLTVIRQQLVGQTDVLTIETKGQKPKKGEKKIKTLYFNVGKAFEKL